MTSILVLGKWGEVRSKAKRLRDDGAIQNFSYAQDMITAKVKGDNGTYDVELYRQYPGSYAVTMYSCSCPWGEWAFKRQHTYVGRTCSHALAVLFEAQAEDSRIAP